MRATSVSARRKSRQTKEERDQIVLDHLSAREGDRDSRPREPAGSRRPRRPDSRRRHGPLRCGHQVRRRQERAVPQLRQAPHQGRDPGQPAPVGLGFARSAPPPEAGGMRPRATWPRNSGARRASTEVAGQMGVGMERWNRMQMEMRTVGLVSATSRARSGSRPHAGIRRHARIPARPHVRTPPTADHACARDRTRCPSGIRRWSSCTTPTT